MQTLITPPPSLRITYGTKDYRNKFSRLYGKIG